MTFGPCSPIMSIVENDMYQGWSSNNPDSIFSRWMPTYMHDDNGSSNPTDTSGEISELLVKLNNHLKLRFATPCLRREHVFEAWVRWLRLLASASEPMPSSTPVYSSLEARVT